MYRSHGNCNPDGILLHTQLGDRERPLGGLHICSVQNQAEPPSRPNRMIHGYHGELVIVNNAWLNGILTVMAAAVLGIHPAAGDHLEGRGLLFRPEALPVPQRCVVSPWNPAGLYYLLFRCEPAFLSQFHQHGTENGGRGPAGGTKRNLNRAADPGIRFKRGGDITQAVGMSFAQHQLGQPLGGVVPGSVIHSG